MVQDKKNLDIEFPLIVPKISSDIIFSRINADFDHWAFLRFFYKMHVDASSGFTRCTLVKSCQKTVRIGQYWLGAQATDLV